MGEMGMSGRINDLPCELTVCDREEWLKMRKHKIGGSDVAAIMGLSPFKSSTPYKVWAEKTGLVEPEDISDKPTVEWGTRLEGVIANKFRRTHQGYVALRSTPGHMRTLIDPKRPWAMATVDGLLRYWPDESVPLSILEIKTAHSYSAKDWGESGSGAAGVPVYYLTQVYHYMGVTGLRKAYVAVLIDGYDYREYEIDYDETEVKAVVDAVDTFWHENVEKNIAPEATVADNTVFTKAHPATEGFDAGSAEDLEKVEEYRELKAKAAAYKDAADEAASALKQRIGSRGGLTFDEGTLTWARYSRKKVDAKAMKEEDPALCRAYQELEKQFTTDVLRDYGLRWKDAK